MAFCLALASCSTPAQPRLAIEEHLLTSAPDISTDSLIFHFAGGDQDHLLARTQPYRDAHQQISEFNRRALSPFGYSLRGLRQEDHSYSQIYQGGRLVVGNVIYLSPISVNASGSDFIGLVDLPDGQHQFTRSGLADRPQRFRRAPYAYVGDRLLSIEVTGATPQDSTLSVYLADALAYQTSFMDVSTYGPFDGPWSYSGHWALVILDGRPADQGGPEMLTRVIQDGRDANSTRGYEQSFEFAVLGGLPFYFYERAGKIGISFAGEDQPPVYDEIPHYQCCSGSLLNPGRSLNMVWFFARRAANWYYVEARTTSQSGQ